MTASDQLAAFAETKGFTFRKLESLGDTILILTGTRWEHGVIIAQIQDQVRRPRTCKVTNVDLQLTADPGELVPDLIVVPEQLAPGAKPWAHETELLVEVVSQRNYREDYEGKRRRYAGSGAPQYLIVDPRDGLCMLHTEPIKSKGNYEQIVTTKFGQPVTGVLCMDGAELDTSEFLRYT
ncbi:Uma2 family endonuclease [Actinomadura rubrisoli]|uniref:Uma2 family endonuclease n=1 Tax=Actinomadura rubrisoli TaxID=2530368 RepID=UPI00140451B2|nr:Uma2 family endonuclease [Actinomadura rubrisoli]